jgi:inner membrane protein
MATYLHFAPAVALAVAIGPGRIGWRLALAGAACAVLPDADLLMHTLHFDRYSGTYGHRGFTHSLGFALLVGVLGALLAGLHPPRSRWLTAAYLALCTASHPLLDGLIDRGICNAWLWPLDGARHCLAWRPIPMQGVPLFGLDRLGQELLWIGVPLLLLANAGMALRWAARSVRRALAKAAGPGARGRPLAVDARGAALPLVGPRAQRRQRVAALRSLVACLRQQHRQRPGNASRLLRATLT